MKFLVAADNIVHVTKHCDLISGGTVLYVTTPQTVEEMIEHLARPDSKSDWGRKVSEGPPILAACSGCLLGDNEEI